MGCNSALCTANTSKPVLAADAIIPFGSTTLENLSVVVEKV